MTNLLSRISSIGLLVMMGVLCALLMPFAKNCDKCSRKESCHDTEPFCPHVDAG